MTPQAYIGIDYKNLRNREHPHSYSVLRAKFDAWFAEQAEKAGAVVVPEDRGRKADRQERPRCRRRTQAGAMTSTATW